MSAVVYTRWLKPRDARAIARLERKAYRRDQRNGRRAIAADLREAERSGTNLSLGLFDGARLVGFVLAYICRDRAAVFEDFEVHHEDAAGLTGESVYVEDVIVLPRYSRSLFLLLTKWTREVYRRDPNLPLDAFCEPALLERWTKYSRGFRHKGMALDRTLKVTDLTGDQEWYWFSWRQVGERPATAGSDTPPGTVLKSAHLPDGCQARLVRTEADWERLRPAWDDMIDAHSIASPFASIDYLQAWWRHYGVSRHLHIVTLYRDARLVGIAPMMVAPKRILGRYRWRLELIGDRANMERLGPIVDPSTPAALELLWQAVMSTSQHWHAVYLREQAMETGKHPAMEAMEAMDDRRYTASLSEPMQSPHVDLRDPWPQYLASRSRSLRKNYRRRLRQLGKVGELQCVDEAHFDCPEACLAAYLDVERRSWKATTPFGVGGHPIRRGFYADLVHTLSARGEARFRFLLLDGQPVAATFGVVRRGQFASLEICHDSAFDRYSPGVVLTGLELEALMAEEDCLEYDFLIGTYANKSAWATKTVTARHVYLLPRNAWGQINRFLIFRVKAGTLGLLSRLGLDDRAADFYDRVRNRLG